MGSCGQYILQINLFISGLVCYPSPTCTDPIVIYIKGYIVDENAFVPHR